MPKTPHGMKLVVFEEYVSYFLNGLLFLYLYMLLCEE